MLSFEGAFTAILTPFNEEGEIEFDYMLRHLRYQEENGIDGVIPCGTNGEGPSLSLDERKRVIRFVVENKGRMLVIAGTGCSNLPETIELTTFAAEAGADAALVLPPFYFKNLDDRGTADYYRRVLDAAPIPVLLYNIPSYSGVEITEGVLRSLADRANLAGVKDSSGNVERTRAYASGFPRLQILNGSDWCIEAALAGGAAGTISGIGNVYPELVAGLYDAWQAGQDVSAWQAKINELKEVFDRCPPMAANKFGLTLRGFPSTYVRPPLVDLSPTERRRMEEEIRRSTSSEADLPGPTP